MPNAPAAGFSQKDTLRLRRVAIDTYREQVAFLHRSCPLYQAEGFQALSKIHIEADGHSIEAVLNVVDEECITGPEELGLSEQAFAALGLPEGERVRVCQADAPASMQAVQRKIAGHRLSQDDFHGIAQDIVRGRYSKMEMAAFLVASTQNGLDRDEIFYLTRAMIDSGQRLNWHEPLVVDKHCIGGIPGNRTTMLIVPIVAAHGTLIPKTSSRSITSPAGTADTMEMLAEVNLAPELLRDLVHEERGCLAWGGTAALAPMDDLLIAVERPLAIDAPAQMVASILSKKVAAGSTHLLIDIPVGPTAKVRDMSEALSLRKLFEYVGDQLGLHLEVILTDGRQPIGRGIGPALEARDVMAVLENDPEAPEDLRQKSLRLAGRILEFDPDVRGGQGYAIARDILDSGRALEKMRRIIARQGTKQAAPLGELTRDVVAEQDGVVIDIDNFHLARLARRAGAPINPGAGIDLFKKLGDAVQKGEPLYRVYSSFRANHQFAEAFLAAHGSGYRIGSEAEIPLPFGLH